MNRAREKFYSHEWTSFIHGSLLLGSRNEKSFFKSWKVFWFVKVFEGEGEYWKETYESQIPKLFWKLTRDERSYLLVDHRRNLFLKNLWFCLGPVRSILVWFYLLSPHFWSNWTCLVQLGLFCWFRLKIIIWSRFV